MVKFSDKGSGWYEQPGRHRNAKKFGVAGGQYSAPTRSKKLRKLTYGQLKKKGVKLSPKGDADHDGVINKKDCRPFNPKMQDESEGFFEPELMRRVKEDGISLEEARDQLTSDYPEAKGQIKLAYDQINQIKYSPSYKRARAIIGTEMDNAHSDPIGYTESMGWKLTSKQKQKLKDGIYKLDYTDEEIMNLARQIRKYKGTLEAMESNEASDFTANLVATQFNKILGRR